jgi:hypothetical protein
LKEAEYSTLSAPWTTDTTEARLGHSVPVAAVALDTNILGESIIAAVLATVTVGVVTVAEVPAAVAVADAARLQ